MNKQLLGNGQNQIYRIGDKVMRKGGPWSNSVQAVLGYLHDKGFAYSPKPLGVDEEWEHQTFLPGESMLHPWKGVLRNDDGLAQVAKMLRQLHDITTELELPDNTIWRTTTAGKKRGQIIRHGDLGPWNTLWQHDHLTGLIDWEFTMPGKAITDLAQVAWYYIPLREEAGWQKSGFTAEPDFKHRLQVLCESYGAYSPLEVLKELNDLQNLEIEQTIRRGGNNEKPWINWLESGQIDEFRSENKFLTEHVLPSLHDGN